MKKYAINLAGFFYIVGNAAQLILGTLTYSPRQIASSVLLITSSFFFMLAGHKKYGVPVGGILAFFGVFLAAWPGLADMEAGTIFGVIAVIPSVLFGVFSEQLRKKYLKNKIKLIRQTMGHPRRIMGLTSLALCRLPIIYDDAVYGRWESLALFSIWLIADFTASLSDTD